MSQAEDVKRVTPASGSPYIPAKARITDLLPPVNANDAGTKAYVDAAGTGAVDTLTAQFPALCDDNDVLRAVDGIVDAFSARIENVDDAVLTNQGDAINVNTLVTEFPNLLDDNDALRVINAEIDAQSARIKNLANAVLTNQNDAVNVGMVKEVFLDTAPVVDPITLDLITITLDTLTDVTPYLQSIGQKVNALVSALNTQNITQESH